MTLSWRWWWLGALVAGGVGVGIALWRAPDSIVLPADVGSHQQPKRPADPKPAPIPAPPLLASPGVPPGITADDWSRLQRELAGRPDELQRIAAHLRYAETLRRFRSRAAGDDVHALARTLDDGLDERLRQRELSAGEARLVKLALLDVLEPDAAQRPTLLARWEAAHAPAPDGAQRAATAREADFQRRQAALVAAWQSLPPGKQDPRALERDLDALRQASFGAPTSGATR